MTAEPSVTVERACPQCGAESKPCNPWSDDAQHYAFCAACELHHRPESAADVARREAEERGRQYADFIQTKTQLAHDGADVDDDEPEAQVSP